MYNFKIKMQDGAGGFLFLRQKKAASEKSKAVLFRNTSAEHSILHKQKITSSCDAGASAASCACVSQSSCDVFSSNYPFYHLMY